MKLNEQLYKKPRVYYHGSDVPSLCKLVPQKIQRTDNKVVYLTTNAEYAYRYASKATSTKDARVYICKFTRELDIFNGNHLYDMSRLKRLNVLTSEDEAIIRYGDWITFDSLMLKTNVANKSYLIEMIADLGYDGFYNNESNVKHSTKDSGIGIFNESDIKIVDELTLEDAIKKLHLSSAARQIEDESVVVEFLKEHNLEWSEYKEKIEYLRSEARNEKR